MPFGNVWWRLFARNRSRISPLGRWFRLRLEHLEDRTLPSVSMLFDSAAGQLSLHGDGSDAIIRQTLSSSGFVEVAVDGQQHSADPKSEFFDQALAGANAGNLAGTRLDGGGHDTLILAWDGFENRPTGSLAVSAAGAEVVAQDVTIAGKLTIQAQHVKVDGALRASAIALAGSGWVTIDAGGQLAANQIGVAADVFVNSGQLHADGLTGGHVTITSRNVLNAGGITADGSGRGDGGAVRIAFTGSYIDTASAVTSANGGAAGRGGGLSIDASATGRLFSSGAFRATGSLGGRVDLFGREVVLDGATVDASGESGGGSIQIGGERVGQVANLPSRLWQVDNLPHNSNTVTVTSAAAIRADALGTGDGGLIVVWSDQDTQFDGSVSAHGGPAGGAGGFIEVSSKGTLAYSGNADSGAPTGKAGTLLLDPKNLIIDAVSGALPQFDFVDPHPTASAHFAALVTVLSTGNVVVTNPDDNFGGDNAGAVYLYNGLTGALLSSLVGGQSYDSVGNFGVTVLSNGNYVVSSPNWNGTRGAATWGDSTTGVSGPVSADNSIVGNFTNDFMGTFVTALSNGNYVVSSPSWNGNRGAATWGAAGVAGVVSADNSLVGSDANDFVSSSGVTVLSGGNYVVKSPNWNGNRGAATWGNGAAGVSGAVSAANSLVGSNSNDFVGVSGVTALNNGNYVVNSPNWNGNYGAATWGSGVAGVTGAIAAANSLVGSNTNDLVGVSGVTALSNGNYVVNSPNWNDNHGAATWGSGTTGVTGAVSTANSLVGSNSNDFVGSLGATPLSNGNFVVRSTNWNGSRGAATWGNGAAGVTGVVSAANSLVGSNAYDLVSSNDVWALSNGNYVVSSPYWNGSRGAATWGNGAAGVTGVVSAANSLVGSNANDIVSSRKVLALSNGNYVVISPDWNGSRGAATWGSGTAGVSGAVSATNSLAGSDINDNVGLLVTALSNGNYVVASWVWNGGRGAATWGSGTAGVSGVVSVANSLVGSSVNDHVGGDAAAGVAAVQGLSNGNYVVLSRSWNGNRGAATWGSGTIGIAGAVSAANSLVGSNPNDGVGNGGITPLSDGNYLVRSTLWNGNRGAVTPAGGTSGQTLDGNSAITPQNSIVGPIANAGLGSVLEDSLHRAFVMAFTSDGTDRVTSGFVNPNQLTYARGQSQTMTITPALLRRTLNAGGAVVLQASNDITINSAITVTAGGTGGALTLQAGRSILINASVTTDNGALTLMANDQLANGVVNSQRDPGPAVITMAGGAALNTGSGTLTIDLRDGAGLTNSDSGAITLRTVVAGSISVVNDGPSAGSDVILGPVTTAGTQSYANPNGTTTITANLAAGGNAVTFNNAAVLANGLTLGAGSDTFTFAGGTVAPAPGILTIAGSLSLSGAATFSATLNGTDPGSYSQITATGPIDLGSSILALTLGFTPEVGNSFTVLSSAFGPIIGTFAGLDEGATFTQDGILFQITYQGGSDGTSVVLTRLA